MSTSSESATMVHLGAQYLPSAKPAEGTEEVGELAISGVDPR